MGEKGNTPLKAIYCFENAFYSLSQNHGWLGEKDNVIEKEITDLKNLQFK